MTDHRTSTYFPRDPRERLAIAALCAAGLFVFGGDLWKMADRARHGLRNEVRENMPIEIEIERAREMAASLVPDLRRNHEVIVREQVEMEELRADIAKSRDQLDEQREELLAIRKKLTTINPVSATTEQKPSTSTIRKELRQRFAAFQSADATLQAKTQMLKYREEALAKAEAAQNTMLLKKRELEAQVTQLASRVRLIQRDGVDSHVVVNQDKLARCEELLRYLRKRLTIAERVSEFSEQGITGDSLSEKDPGDDTIEVEIDRHFEQDKI